jgi:hypothetical protein
LAESDRYNDQILEVLAKDNTKYELASGWRTDSLGNISGRGLKVVGDSAVQFKGTNGQNRTVDPHFPAIGRLKRMPVSPSQPVPSGRNTAGERLSGSTSGTFPGVSEAD